MLLSVSGWRGPSTSRRSCSASAKAARPRHSGPGCDTAPPGCSCWSACRDGAGPAPRGAAAAPRRKRLGLAIPALAPIQPGQVVHAGQRVGMARAQHLAAQLQRLGEKRFGLAIPALALIQPARLFMLVSVSGWRGPSTSRRSCSASAKSGSASPYRPWLLIQHRQVVHAGQRVGMARAEGLPGQSSAPAPPSGCPRHTALPDRPYRQRHSAHASGSSGPPIVPRLTSRNHQREQEHGKPPPRPRAPPRTQCHLVTRSFDIRPAIVMPAADRQTAQSFPAWLSKPRAPAGSGRGDRPKTAPAARSRSWPCHRAGRR